MTSSEVIQKYLDPDRLQIVAVGDAKEGFCRR